MGDGCREEKLGRRKKEEGRREEEGWTGMSLEVMADKRNAGKQD